MEELRQAMQDYMRQLAEQAQDGENQQANNNQGETQEITQDQLQQMLDRIQELMEQGRMDEAQALLDQLREMMEEYAGPQRASKGSRVSRRANRRWKVWQRRCANSKV